MESMNYFLYDARTQYVVSVEYSDGRTAATMRVYDNEFNLNVSSMNSKQ